MNKGFDRKAILGKYMIDEIIGVGKNAILLGGFA
jgi:hypothetical protein